MSPALSPRAPDSVSDSAAPHVLYAITRTERGGAQQHVRDLMGALAGNVRLTLVCGDQDVRSERDWLAQEAEALGAVVHLVPSLVHPLSPRLDVRAFVSLVRLVRALRPTLVHAHSSKAGILARLAARAAGVPALFTAHGWAFTDGAPRLNARIAVPLERLAARLANGVISVSAYDDRRAEAVGIRGPRAVVPNGLTDVPERARPGDTHPDEAPVVAMVSRFAPPKRQDLVVEALARIDAPWRLLLVGDGPREADVRALAVACGVADRITFAGARSDVAACLASAHVGVLASDYEGLPLGLIEALRAGLPVVGSNVGGIPELVVSGETGMLAKNTPEAWAAALEPLLCDPERRRRMGTGARAHYERAFSLGRMVRETLAVYRRAVPVAPWPSDAEIEATLSPQTTSEPARRAWRVNGDVGPAAPPVAGPLVARA